MGRRAKKVPVPPWLTGKAYKWSSNKSMPPWAKLDMTLLQDESFGELSNATRLLYLCMMVHAGDKALDWFTFTEKEAKRYNIARTTLQRGVKELEAAGFIKSRRPDITDEKVPWSVAKYAPTQYAATPTDWKNRKPLKDKEKRNSGK